MFIIKDKYLVLIGVLALILFLHFGIGIPYLIPDPSRALLVFDNSTCFGCDAPNDPTILILIGVIIPIVILISVIVRYFPKKEVEFIE